MLSIWATTDFNYSNKKGSKFHICCISAKHISVLHWCFIYYWTKCLYLLKLSNFWELRYMSLRYDNHWKLDLMFSTWVITSFYDSNEQMVKILTLVLSQQHVSQFYNDVSSTTEQNVSNFWELICMLLRYDKQQKLGLMFSTWVITSFYDINKHRVKFFIFVISQQLVSQFYNIVSSTTEQNVSIH